MSELKISQKNKKNFSSLEEDPTKKATKAFKKKRRNKNANANDGRDLSKSTSNNQQNGNSLEVESKQKQEQKKSSDATSSVRKQKNKRRKNKQTKDNGSNADPSSPGLHQQIDATLERGKTTDVVAPVIDGAENGFIKVNVPPNLVARLLEMGITKPTPIQKEAIPLAIQGRDIMGLAQTGTGKTLAFGLPLVIQMQATKTNGKAIRGLVLAPTRELANQIAVQLGALTHNSSPPIKAFVVVGGVNINPQIDMLRRGVDILVATPGRLIDLMDRGSVVLKDTSFLVLDEADQMLDMGFLPSLKKIEKKLPRKRQTMCFSATMSKDMNTVVSSYLNNPARIEVARAGKTADKIAQELHFVAKSEKGAKLLELLSNPEHRNDRALIFGRTKHGMEKLSKKLIAAGFQAGSIHGNKSQSQRDRAIAAFKSGEMKVLVATDVAARGLDIPDVKHVYNYELPNVPEAYVHRIGRTARAGKEGTAIAFCSMEEMDDLLDIEKVMGVKIPVASGEPWSKDDTRQEKLKIKENKELNKKKQREQRSKKPKRPQSHFSKQKAVE